MALSFVCFYEIAIESVDNQRQRRRRNPRRGGYPTDAALRESVPAFFSVVVWIVDFSGHAVRAMRLPLTHLVHKGCL